MRKILIVTTCIDDWGGSEELWGRSTPFLQEAGFEISIVKENINKQHPEYIKLAENNIKLIEIFPRKSTAFRIKKKAGKLFTKIAIGLKMAQYGGEDFSNYIKILKNNTPELVIISQGINFDGLKLAYQCSKLEIPYVVIAQKAVDFYWPYFTDRDSMSEALSKSQRIFFVSKHNLRLTEEQFGKRLTNGHVIFNPMKLSGKVVPFPKSEKIFKLACLGRLFLLDKGQDILIRIMSEQKWKERPIMISFIGKGNDEKALKEMAALLGVSNVEFKGQIDDVESMWKDYHALILPSRSEGLPLSMVEAMSAGRPVIISNAGGNAELVEEGKTGFIGYPNEQSFSDAMERAWEERHNWEEIGLNAAKHIAQVVPKLPEKDFAKIIIKMLNVN